jgi:hypothetical protein
MWRFRGVIQMYMLYLPDSPHQARKKRGRYIEQRFAGTARLAMQTKWATSQAVLGTVCAKEVNIVHEFRGRTTCF